MRSPWRRKQKSNIHRILSQDRTVIQLRTCWKLTSAESCFRSLSPPVSRTNHVSIKNRLSQRVDTPSQQGFHWTLDMRNQQFMVAVLSRRFLWFLVQMGVRGKVSLCGCLLQNVTQTTPKEEDWGRWIQPTTRQKSPPLRHVVAHKLQLHSCVAKHARNGYTYW